MDAVASLSVAGRVARTPPAKPASLAEAVRGDVTLVLLVRESRSFALDLASVLFGISFVRVTRDGEVDGRVPPWRCTALQAATLISEMRGANEDPKDFLDGLQSDLIIRNTATEIEDHVNRLGWRVW